MNGEVVWYNPAKCYGFVAPVEGGGDLVFHLDETDLAGLGTIKRGMAVHFVVAAGPSGPVARRLEAGHLPEG